MGENSISFKITPLSNIRNIILILNYVIGYMYVYPAIGAKITLAIDPQAVRIFPFLQFLIYTTMIVTSIWIGLPLLKESVQSLKKGTAHLFRNCFFLLACLYSASIVLSTFASFMSNTTTSANQLDVSNSVRMNPYLMIVTTLVFAPIVEEMLFRGVIFRTLRSRCSFLVAAFVSCLAFGFIHVSDSLFNMQFYDVWYIFVYAGIGFFLAMAYEKTDSIYGSMLLHFLNNLIAVCSILLI